MTIFYKHLYLFDTLNNIKKFNITNFEREKVFQEEDVVLYVLKNNKDEVVYRFAIADTDINAIYSFFKDERFKSYSLLYILRKKEILNYLNQKETYDIPVSHIEHIHKEYKQILNRNLNDDHEMYINMRLVDATFELNDELLSIYLNEFDNTLHKIKDLIEKKDEMNLEKSTVMFLIDVLMKDIVKSHMFYLHTPIENFSIEKSLDYINKITFNRLSDEEKVKIKEYYDKLPNLWEYHSSKENCIEKIGEAEKLLKSIE